MTDLNPNVPLATNLHQDTKPPSGEAPPLWNPRAAAVWSFILNPILGSVLMALNWKALGKADKAQKAWLYAGVFVLITAALLALPMRLPGSGIALSAAWYYAAGKEQITYVAGQYGQTYPRRGWLAPLSISFTVIAAIVAVFVLASNGEE